jgi:hypothetical protein
LLSATQARFFLQGNFLYRKVDLTPTKKAFIGRPFCWFHLVDFN